MDPLTEKLVLAGVTFVLTSILGGALTALFQFSSWKRQQLLTREAELRKTRETIFSEVSRLMDRRLYRLKRLHWALAKSAPERDAALADYRAVIFEWNDSINRILAMLQVYLSDEIRHELDNGIGRRFVELGAQVESMLKSRQAPSDAMAHEIEALAGGVYFLNVRMLGYFKLDPPKRAPPARNPP